MSENDEPVTTVSSSATADVSRSLTVVFTIGITTNWNRGGIVGAVVASCASWSRGDVRLRVCEEMSGEWNGLAREPCGDGLYVVHSGVRFLSGYGE